MTPTDEGADEVPRLTQAQLEAIRRINANPAFAQSMARMQETLNAFNRQMSTNLLTGVAPTLEKWREQHRQIAKSIAPMINYQAQLEAAAAPLAQRIAESQREIARQLNVMLQAQATSVVISPGFTEAIQRINAIAWARLAVPTEDGIARLNDLINSGAIDSEIVAEAEAGVAENAELSEAIDLAALELSKRHPLISRRRARQIVVFWVWLMYGAALWALAVLTPAGIGAIPGAIGLPSAPAVAKKVGDKLVPTQDEQDDKDEVAGAE